MPKTRKLKQQEITMAEYTEKLDMIIEKCQSISDTLIELLEEAGKYKIKDSK